MRKKVILYFDPRDASCGEIKDYLQGQSLELRLHDISTDPLSSSHIASLLRHFDLRHFLNAEQNTYKKHNFDNNLPQREEVFELIAEDNNLMQWPIITAGRLMSVRPNRKAVKDMLEMNPNGSEPGENRERPIKRRSLKS